jgi:hypothetical protein
MAGARKHPFAGRAARLSFPAESASVAVIDWNARLSPVLLSYGNIAERLLGGDEATPSEGLHRYARLMVPIWTLDSRDDQFLVSMEDYWGLSVFQVRGLIMGMHAELIRMLQDEGLDYSSFRNALVPQSHKQERAFIFKTTLIEDGWYGGAIAQQLVPSLDADHTCSILSGDLILSDQQAARAALSDTGVFHRSFHDVHTTMLHAIYFNNLTETRAQELHDKLKLYEPYIGYIPAMYSSIAKELMSLVLATTYLKVGRHWLCESDGDETMGRSNVPSWPLADHGYTCHSGN